MDTKWKNMVKAIKKFIKEYYDCVFGFLLFIIGNVKKRTGDGREDPSPVFSLPAAFVVEFRIEGVEISAVQLLLH